MQDDQGNTVAAETALLVNQEKIQPAGPDRIPKWIQNSSMLYIYQ
jgi:hypothetical protein